MRAFFSPKYTVDMGEHVFATEKFALTAQKLLRDGLLKASDLVEPAPASREDLCLAHTEAWVDRTLNGTMTPVDIARAEVPNSPSVLLAHRLAVGGTILACREALSCGLGLHIGGGSHHALPDAGEGFCLFNDIAIGILKMIQEGRVARAAVIDLDVHQGNGTAAIFAGNPDVFTFSMHQQDNYPKEKSASRLDIGLPDGIGDADYLARLEEALPRVLESSRPELVVYQAGADVFAKDMLGGLRLTREGIAARDRAVFNACFERGVPVALTLGGGYAARLEDTVSIHAKTCVAALDAHRHYRREGVPRE